MSKKLKCKEQEMIYNTQHELPYILQSFESLKTIQHCKSMQSYSKKNCELVILTTCGSSSVDKNRIVRENRDYSVFAPNCNIFSVLSISKRNPDEKNDKFITS